MSIGVAARRFRPAVSLLASLYVAVQLCLVAWVAAPGLLLGWTPRVVLSDSMAPGLRAGDVVLVGKASANRLPVGTLAVFRTAGSGESVIHRIVDNSEGVYRTKGDANPTLDARPVRSAQIRGVGRLLVPMIGLPAKWAQNGDPALAAAWAVSTLGAAVLSRRHPGRRRRLRVRR